MKEKKTEFHQINQIKETTQSTSASIFSTPNKTPNRTNTSNETYLSTSLSSQCSFSFWDQAIDNRKPFQKSACTPIKDTALNQTDNEFTPIPSENLTTNNTPSREPIQRKNLLKMLRTPSLNSASKTFSAVSTNQKTISQPTTPIQLTSSFSIGSNQTTPINRNTTYQREKTYSHNPYSYSREPANETPLTDSSNKTLPEKQLVFKSQNSSKSRIGKIIISNENAKMTLASFRKMRNHQNEASKYIKQAKHIKNMSPMNHISI